MFKKTLAVLALSLAASSAFAMSATEQNATLLALDDEYKAYSTYFVVIEKHGEIRPFTNIINAETGHISALVEALTADGIEIPENPYLNGEKPRPEAPDTVQASCALGVAAEIANAALYDDELLPMVEGNEELTTIFNNLRDASNDKHLKAFERCAN